VTDLNPQPLLSDGLGHRLSQVRSTYRWSLRELAASSGVAHSTIFRIEQGIGTPSISAVERLATALCVTPAWLAFGEAPR
jgi:transcriptional regulator with XRE-family HTH domain